MNSKELRIYTLLTHPTSPQSYEITDDGTKLWVMVDGTLVGFDGEGLDKMTASSLYFFYREKLQEHRMKIWKL